MPMATDSGTEAACESPLSCSSSHTATGGGCCGASPPLVGRVRSPHATCWTKVSTKEARRRRRDRCGRLGGRSSPASPTAPSCGPCAATARRRACPGPARTAARAGAPQIHQVLLLDLQWGANCRPARHDARRGGGR